MGANRKTSGQTRPGIFCLEGEWSTSMRDKSSVLPLLHLLRDRARIDFVYRDVGTPEELRFYADRWGQRQYDRFRIGYFAFHGSEERLHIGRTDVSLTELGEILRNRATGRSIHFGSCETVVNYDGAVDRFLKVTRARCVSGYVQDADWIPSAALDLLFFEALAYWRRLDTVERYMKRDCGSLVKALGFRMYRR